MAHIWLLAAIEEIQDLCKEFGMSCQTNGWTERMPVANCYTKESVTLPIQPT